MSPRILPSCGHENLTNYKRTTSSGNDKFYGESTTPSKHPHNHQPSPIVFQLKNKFQHIKHMRKTLKIKKCNLDFSSSLFDRHTAARTSARVQPGSHTQFQCCHQYSTNCSTCISSPQRAGRRKRQNKGLYGEKQ